MAKISPNNMPATISPMPPKSSKRCALRGANPVAAAEENAVLAMKKL
jgi:hypothetical protein